MLLLLIAGASSNVSAGLSFANSARLAPAPRLPADTYVQLRSNHQRMTNAKAIHPSPSAPRYFLQMIMMQPSLELPAQNEAEKASEL